MPLSKDLSKFPILEYTAIMMQALKEDGLVIPCGEEKNARRSRHEISHVLHVMRNDPAYNTREPFKTMLMQFESKPIAMSIHPNGDLRFFVKHPMLLAYARSLLLTQPTLLAQEPALPQHSTPTLPQPQEDFEPVDESLKQFLGD